MTIPPLDADTLKQVFDHAEQVYPRECCGYLCLGPGEKWRVVPCVNQQDRLHALDPIQYPRDAKSAYHIGGKDLLGLVRHLESDTPVRIIYHSHPEGGAYFSQTDSEAALAVGYPVDYLVIDAQGGKAQGAKLFTQEGQSFQKLAQYSADSG